MPAVVFLGPTLDAAAARELFDADYRPPVAQGDVYRAVRAGAPAIGIVDGFFQSQPSVWHKEILWALHEGVHVYGAASMGALRAAELATFGMVGVGEIFERLRERALIADDEVALVHGPAELGYRPMSVALVDIRATLAAAVERGVVDAEVAGRLCTIAARTFYPERRWEHLIETARDRGIAAAPLDRLERALPAVQVSRKRADALAMLRRMAADAGRRPGPFRPGFRFEETLLWREMVARIENPILQTLGP